MSDSQGTQPPQPPEIKRTLQFHLTQLIGVPLLAVLPVLALLGVFGTTRGEASAQSAALELHVEYPTRSRYKVINAIEVSVRNLTEQPLSTVTVSFDETYISKFSNVQFTPSVKTVTDEVYRVELSDLQPGETQLVSVEVQAEEYGAHRGTIKVAAGEAEAAQVDLATIVFP